MKNLSLILPLIIASAATSILANDSLTTKLVFNFKSTSNTQIIAESPNSGKNFQSFTDWCKQKSNLFDETKHTVEVLLQKAGTQNCYQANQKLTHLTGLILDSNKISDIKP
jgi:hypothetical protein